MGKKFILVSLFVRKQVCDMNDDLQFWIPVVISIIAIVFTGYQQFIANKQFLFEKRLYFYRIYKILVKHQEDAALHFKNKSPEELCVDDMLIGTLTNDAILESGAIGWNDRNDDDSLMKIENHKSFRAMIEKLRSYGIESSFVFIDKHGKNLYNYFNKYADLCDKTYQYSILRKGIEDENKRLNARNDAIHLDTIKDKQKPLHIELNQIYDDLCKISKLINISDLEKSISFIRRRQLCKSRKEK